MYIEFKNGSKIVGVDSDKINRGCSSKNVITFVNEDQIHLIVSKFIIDVIEENEICKWVYAEEPFYNFHKNKVSYDYSGEVVKMSLNEFENIAQNSSSLEELLHELYVDRWEPTFISNYGKRWVDFLQLVNEKYDEWKYGNFELYDEDGNELNEELEIKLDETLRNFLENAPMEFYIKKIEQKLKDNML